MSDSQDKALKKIADLEGQLESLRRSLLPPTPEQTAAQFPLDAIVFKVDGVVAAVRVAIVDEVVPMVYVTPLPRAPKAIRGTFNYHGRIVPVLDLNFSLTGRTAPLAAGAFLIVLTVNGRTLALAIDEILRVEPFSEEAIDENTGVRTLPPFVHCLLRSDVQTIIFLDPSLLLAVKEYNLVHELIADVVVQNEETSE